MAAAGNQITLLSEIDGSNNIGTLRVCIIRLWRNISKRNPKETYSIEFVLVDEQGNRIHGNVMKTNIHRFEKFLKEQSPMTIRKPDMGTVYGNFRYTDTIHKIILSYDTIVTTCADFNGSRYGFCFASFKDVKDRNVSTKQSIDLIGVLSEYNNLEDCTTYDGTPTKRMKIQLQDIEGLDIWMTLFGEYGIQMNQYLTDHPQEENIVVILQFAKFKQWKGGYSVSNCLQVSRLFVNVDIEDINNFKIRMIANPESQGSSSLKASSMLYSVEREFLEKYQFCTIDDVLSMDEPKQVVVVGLISGIQRNVSWYYDACNQCNFKADRKLNTNDLPDGSRVFSTEDVWVCNNVKCSKPIVVVPRYKIPIEVEDQSGKVTLTLWERHARKLLGKEALEVKEEFYKSDVMEAYPSELKALLQRKFAFRIDVTEKSMKWTNKIFAILNLTDDSNVVEELEGKLASQMIQIQDSLNNSSNQIFSDSTSDIQVIPLGSSSGKTPTSENTYAEDYTSLVSPDDSRLKRKLIDVYESEDVENNSKTISPFEEDNEVSKGCVGKLLIPKLENK